MRRLSGLQKSVLSLYRSCLRHTRALAAPARLAAVRYLRVEFRERAALDRLDYQRIEFLVRQGGKRLNGATTTNVSSFEYDPGAPPTPSDRILAGLK